MVSYVTIKPRNIDISGDYVVNSISSSGNVTAGNIKSDHLLYANGTPYVFTTNAAGINTQVQFNDGNSFAGSANLTFNKTTGTLTADFFVGNGSQLTGLPASYTDTDANSAIDARVTKTFIDNLGVNANTLNGHSDTYFATSIQGSLADSAVQPGDNVSDLVNDAGYLVSANLSGYATETYVNTQVSNLVDSAPATLNTLNELAAALGDDANFATTIANSIGNKLSTSDFTSTADTWLATKSTSDVSEGTNQYYTVARANSAIDARVTKTFVDNLSVVANIANIAYSVTGSNVSGQVSNALVAGTVYTNAQPNITSVGVLTGLTVSGLVTATGTGVKAANILDTSGTIAINTKYGNVPGAVGITTDLTVGTSGTGNVTATYFIGDGSQLTGMYSNTNANAAIDARVTKTFVDNLAVVANIANVAYSVAVANVTGIGNIATLNLNGNASTILYGNGVFAAAPVTYNDSNVEAYLPNYTGNLTPGNIIVSSDNLKLSGGTANYVLSTDGSGNLSWVQQTVGTSEFTLTSVDTFNGDGTTTVFTLSVAPSNINQTFVNYNGALQLRSSYSLSGQEITFSEAPADGSEFEITTQMGVTSGSGSLTVRNYTANGSQTDFTVSSGVNATNILVTENGLLQTPTVDYTVTGSTLTFTTAPGNGVKVQIRELGVAVATITPAGSNTQVLFNDAGSFGNSASLTFTKTTNTLSTVNVVASGNITANYIIGNGSQLTGLPAGYTNSNVASYLPTYTGNLSPGNISLGVTNLKVSGGTSGQALVTDGAGNLSFSTVSSSGPTSASVVGYNLVFGG